MAKSNVVVSAHIEAIRGDVCAVFEFAGGRVNEVSNNVGSWASQKSKDVRGGGRSRRIVAAAEPGLLGIGAEVVCKHVREMCEANGYTFKW
jgi:hypothetical protein